MGQVCAKHNEYYEDRCRWCETPETDEWAGYDVLPVGPKSGFYGLSVPSDSYLDGIRRAYDAASALDRKAMIETMERRLKKAEQSLLHDFNKRYYGPAEGPNDGHGSLE